jgi:hypothetical protein
VFDNTRKFTNLDGDEISVTYQPLVHRDAMEIEYHALGLVMGGLSGAFEHIAALFEEIEEVPSDVEDDVEEVPTTEEPDVEDDVEEKTINVPISSTVHVARAIDAVYKSIPFERLYWLGEKILKGSLVQGVGTNVKIDHLSKCNYFTDRLDEFVLAVFWGLDVSFPRAFTKARELLSALGVKRPGQTSQETSNTSSKDPKRNSLR